MTDVHAEQSGFIQLLVILKKNIVFIFAFVFLCAVASVFYSLSLPNIYKSEVKVVPSTDESSGGLGALAGQFGGLASLAGINVGGKGDVNQILDTVKSRSFLKPFIEKYDLTKHIHAVKSWDLATNKLIIDEEVYDEDKKQWVRDVEFPKLPKPSLEESYEEFLDILGVNLNKKTNLITISVNYYSPELAQKWVDLIIFELSEYLRKQDQQKAQESIDFLTNEQSSTQVVEIRTVLSEILKEEYQKKMLTEIRKFYGFDIRDYSYLPEEKASPKRAFLVIGITFFSGILAIFLVFVRLFYLNVRDA